MKLVIEKDWKLTGDQLNEWTAAANSWRLPYWDWAQRQTYEGYENSFSLPYACILDHVPIYPPTGDTARPNPLVSFVNPETDGKGDPLPFGQMPPLKAKWNIEDNATDKTQPPLPVGISCRHLLDETAKQVHVVEQMQWHKPLRSLQR